MMFESPLIAPRRVDSSTRNNANIAVVVLNWNRFEDTVQCIESLQSAEYATLQIILVDNASTDGSAEKLAKKFPELKLVRCPKNGGYAAGNNAGIRVAMELGAEYVMVVNNDVVCEKHSVALLVRALLDDDCVGVAVPKIYYFDQPQKIYAAGGTINKLTCTGRGSYNGVIDDMLEPPASTSVDVSFAPGTALLVRRDVFQNKGFFNEAFFMYFEDVDFSERIHGHFKIRYVPQSKVYHKVGAGVGWSSYTPLYLYYYTRNRFWHFNKGSIVFKSYVLFFSFCNALAKSCVIIWATKSLESKRGEKLKALWRGFGDGVRYWRSWMTISPERLPSF